MKKILSAALAAFMAITLLPGCPTCNASWILSARTDKISTRAIFINYLS